MAGKAKFDQEAAFKSIIGSGREAEQAAPELPVAKEKNKDRVQRSYFLDRDIEKALRRKAMEEEKNLTETINVVLRAGLAEYVQED
jgi:hypothetical protein